MKELEGYMISAFIRNDTEDMTSREIRASLDYKYNAREIGLVAGRSSAFEAEPIIKYGRKEQYRWWLKREYRR